MYHPLNKILVEITNHYFLKTEWHKGQSYFINKVEVLVIIEFMKNILSGVLVVKCKLTLYSSKWSIL